MWERAYVQARAALAQGAFFDAARRFHDIAYRAPDASMRARAAEFEALASYWWQQGYILQSPTSRWPDETRPEALEDKRTIDELAVLYTNTVVWGSGFGVTVGLAADTGEPASIFLPGILMSAAGAGAVALLDLTGKPLRYGVPTSITSGLYLGFEGGMFASFLIGGASRRAPSEGVFAGMVWGASTAGALLGGTLGHTLGTTPGRASFVTTGGLWGGVLSSFIAAGAAPDRDGDATLIAAGSAGLAGMVAGATLTGHYASRMSPSIARVRFMDLGAIGGGLLFGGIYASAASDNFEARPFFLLTALGTGIGLGVATFATRKMDRDMPRRGPATDSAMVMPLLAPQKGGLTAGLSGVF